MRMFSSFALAVLLFGPIAICVGQSSLTIPVQIHSQYHGTDISFDSQYEVEASTLQFSTIKFYLCHFQLKKGEEMLAKLCVDDPGKN